ncbi:uncharacterized protein E0L32_001459 [Thyridium curvatum]|uniref:SGNH hydrolase-type esterase domain-containing protein n=1 Tax=Thyridium curvatum TaxID=1093900 RepID=A0A507AKT1_9PEZI|nr:uncharacterized protein E0L32_001459 [Thyridium curvatum]TPX10262.1 hypothetical protein E0L32_001459 [Thyridium curvatum]
MRRQSLLAALAATLQPLASAAPATVHLCGDSTMAHQSPSGKIQGWGEYLQYSLSPSAFRVNNAAVSGRSARSFTREGRFDAVAKAVRPGDWVVVEFGHNDGGSLSPGRDNGRTDCFGEGSQTCTTAYDGKTEIVQTFPTYLKAATAQFLAAGAKVVISSATPNNPWESGSFSWSGTDRFTYYSWLAASQAGGTARGVYYVPHGAYAAQAMKNMGRQAVNDNFPQDHTHTSPYLADVMSRAFVLGLRCGTSELGRTGVVNSTSSMTSTFLGNCIPAANASMPL